MYLLGLMKNKSCSSVKPIKYVQQMVAFFLELAQGYFQQSSKPLNFLVLTRMFGDFPCLVFLMEFLLFFGCYSF